MQGKSPPCIIHAQSTLLCEIFPPRPHQASSNIQTITDTQHAEDTATHAQASKAISVNIEHLAEQLERLLHQFTLSSNNKG
ncbi:hypothetical protein LRP52_05845 [Photobacterium sp. ZSDE20]|nr:hypothetical protein [Photobacterium sp. ZSDE20]